MKKGKRRIILLLILVIGISIGYAAITTTLKINGTSIAKGQRWNVYWDNVNVDSGSVTGSNVITTPTTSGTTTTEVEFSVVLPEPGDYYEFTVDAVNDGTIDAMIDESGILNKVYSDSTYSTETTLPKVLKYTVTYQDGKEIGEKHLLAQGERETYKVRVEYRNDEEINPSDLDKDNDKTYYFRFNVEYVQADSTAIEIHKIVCKKATTLHTETCDRTSGGCIDRGYTNGDTITYGHTNGNTLTSGYALDCDVSGSKNYERFYYVSDLYTETAGGVDQFDEDYAVLIYSKNIGTSGTAYYNENNKSENWHGPVSLLSNLPTKSVWTNKNLKLKTNSRSIYTETGTTITTYWFDGNVYNLENPFEYTNTVGRLLTTHEIDKAIGSTSRTSNGYLDNAEYLMEDTAYSKTSGCSGETCNYWLETPVSSYWFDAWFIVGDSRYANYDYTNNSYGVRPVIEVKKTDISLD